MSDTDTPFTLPDALRARVEEAAREEATTPDALVHAAIATYLDERTWHRKVDRTVAYGQRRAAELGYTEEDVERLIAESRRERRDA